jgi:hypothetical protein
VLHTRATALQHSSRASRASRNFLVAMAGAAMLATLAACGSDNSTAPRTLATITVTPAAPTLAAGSTQQFTAVGKDADGHQMSITPTWTVSTGGGTIDDNGMLTAGSTAGSFTVTATSGSVSGTSTVTVASSALPVATITLTPATATLAEGATQQFTAVGKDANGDVVAFTPTWSVAAGGGAIDSDGLFTAGSTPGTFANTVSVTNGTIVATATVVVTAPAPAVVGDYTLESIDGKAPPDTVVHTGTATIVFNDGLLSLHADATYRLLFHTSTTTSSGTVSDSSGTIGTYVVQGSTVTIHSTPTDSVVATVALPKLTFSDGGQVFVFSKSP